VTKDGFEPFVESLDLKGTSVELDLKLAIAQERVKISVPAKNLEFANSDPV
jgi:hypothetical protein